MNGLQSGYGAGMSYRGSLASHTPLIKDYTTTPSLAPAPPSPGVDSIDNSSDTRDSKVCLKDRWSIKGDDGHRVPWPHPGLEEGTSQFPNTNVLLRPCACQYGGAMCHQATTRGAGRDGQEWKGMVLRVMSRYATARRRGWSFTVRLRKDMGDRGS